MELTIVIILLIVMLVIIGQTKNNVSSKFMILNRKIDDLADEIRKLRKEHADELPVTKPQELLKPVVVDKPVKPVEHIVPPPVIVPIKPTENKPKEEKPEEKKPEPTPEIVKETEAVEVVSFPTISEKPAPSVYRPQSARPAQPRKPGFFERNPDLEKFIGENLANKIGIGILVLGVGFFVKYAIDQDWIGEIARVFIGILCGGILIGVAHRMRKTFTAFSSVLMGGGIAILYLTIAIAYHEYAIFSQTAAFILMVIITGFTVVLSLSYNRMELAILAILGGFASPFMVSTGEGNYIVLFTYILVLDSGMLVLAYYKKWNLVNIICYVFTLILFGTWLSTKFNGEQVSMIWGALLFATLFYGIFFAMNMVNNIRLRTPFKSIEITLLLSNTFCYYAAGMVILNNTHGEDFRGLFTALLGVFNFVFAYALYKNDRVDRNLVFLLIGLVLTFISLAAPVQLQGNYITLFWAAETVLLLWLSQKSGIKLMKVTSIIIMFLMMISLVMDWDNLYYGGGDLGIILNKAYITGLFSVASIAATIYWLRFEDSEMTPYITSYKTILTVAGVVILYASQFLELQHQLFKYVEHEPAVLVIIGAYNMLFIVALLVFDSKLKMPDQLRTAFASWGVIAMVSFLVFYHRQIVDTRDSYLLGQATLTGFAFHYLYLALLILVSIISLKRVQRLADFNRTTHNLYSWVYIIFYVIVASAELDHTVLMIAYSGADSMEHIILQNHKIGFPILWGLTAFLLIVIGLKTRKKHLRIISLSLLLLTLVKLFLFDIRGISEGGKIAAFISLGLLLLIVSFMYQRLKKLLLTDEPAKETEETNTKEETE